MVEKTGQKTIFAFFTVSLIFFLWPNSVSGLVQADPRTKLSQLKDQLIASQLQFAKIRGRESIPADFAFGKDLKFSDYDPDVVYLQLLLRAEGFFCPDCLVTGYFGAGTRRALSAFQQKYRREILLSQGLSRPSGIVDEPTRRKLNEVLKQARVSLCQSQRPAAPGLVAPKDNVVEQPLSLSFSWGQPINWGRSCLAGRQVSDRDNLKYHFQLAGDADFRQLLVDAFFPASQTEFEIPPGQLVSGTIYHWRVAASNGLESDYRSASFGVSFAPQIDLRVNDSAGPITVNYNNAIELSWQAEAAENCWAEGDWSGPKKPRGVETISNLTAAKTYRLNCSGPGGTAGDEVKVEVLPQPSLALELKARLAESDWQDGLQGLLPLEGIDLKLTVSGNVKGLLNYKIDCDSDGVWDVGGKEISKDSPTEKIITAVCRYQKLGKYTLKTRVERSGLSAEKTLPVAAWETLLPDLALTKIDKLPASSSGVVYAVHLVNRGPAFDQATVYYWSVNYVSQVRGILPGLETGEEKILYYQTTFSARPRIIQFQADASNQLPEASEANNFLTRSD